MKTKFKEIRNGKKVMELEFEQKDCDELNAQAEELGLTKYPWLEEERTAKYGEKKMVDSMNNYYQHQSERDLQNLILMGIIGITAIILTFVFQTELWRKIGIIILMVILFLAFFLRYKYDKAKLEQEVKNESSKTNS